MNGDSSQHYRLGDPQPLRWDHGPVSFGLVLSCSEVSWSAPGARDLLVGRCWGGIQLYPGRDLSDHELAGDPVQVFPPELGDAYALPIDWNRDGAHDILAANRQGFLHPLSRKGSYPALAFERDEPLRDCESGLVFNIPYENPHHPVLDDLGGYYDRGFYNYLYPLHYPSQEGSLDLIVGDWAGNLWWMEDTSGGRGLPRYRGTAYQKRDEDLPTKQGKDLLLRYGRSYVKPSARIRDERGEPFLLGTGSDVGNMRYPGGNARPVVYKDPETGADDLLVIAGTVGNQLLYLKRVGTSSDGSPSFRSLGEARIDGMGHGWGRLLGMHSKIAVIPREGRADLLLSLSGHLAVLRQAGRNAGKPSFELDHVVSAADAMASCNGISEIIPDSTGRRWTVESWGNSAECRRILPAPPGGSIRLSSEEESIHDQAGVFVMKGETDPQGGEDWGWNRLSRWDFDGSGRPHLIAGTDKGFLYLLAASEPLDGSRPFRFRSFGPLSDRSGRVIKVHNRAAAAAIDLDGDGREDLVVGGCSYQAGIALDPSPGGGVYAVLFKGLDHAGVPILEGPVPLPVDGYEYDRKRTNSHVFLQALDVDKDGRKEVILSIQWHDMGTLHVLRPAEGRLALVPTGETIPQPHPIEDYILDLDGDGEWEMVFSGSENGVGHYRKLSGPRSEDRTDRAPATPR